MENGRITPLWDAVVRLAEVFDVSTDHLLIEDSLRRAFRPADNALGDRLASVAELGTDDLALLLGFLDALVTKNRLEALAGGLR